MNGEFGGAGHGGNGGGDSSLSHGNSYGLTDTDLYLGGSTGIEESLTASLTSSALVFMFVISRYLAFLSHCRLEDHHMVDLIILLHRIVSDIEKSLVVTAYISTECDNGPLFP